MPSGSARMPIPQAQLSPYLRVTEGWPRSHTESLSKHYVGSCREKKIGVDPSQFSGHSFRRGGATFAHRMGVSPLLIKLMGDWSSDAYMSYIDHTTLTDLARLPRTLTKAITAMA